MSKKRKMTLCMDFDGVIHGYQSGFQGPTTIPDPPVPGALDFLSTALDTFDVAIYSTRSSAFGGRAAMKKWMREQTTLYINQVVDENKDWARGGRENKYPVLRWLDLDATEPWHIIVREGVDRFVKALSWPRSKPPAIVSIDDRALTFTGQWPTIESLQHFKPWNKK